MLHRRAPKLPPAQPSEMLGAHMATRRQRTQFPVVSEIVGHHLPEPPHARIAVPRSRRAQRQSVQQADPMMQLRRIPFTVPFPTQPPQHVAKFLRP